VSDGTDSAGFLTTGQGQHQAPAVQFGMELGGEASPFLLPEAPQLVEQHQPPENQGEADEHLHADLQHGNGRREAARAGPSRHAGGWAAEVKASLEV